MKRFLFCYYGYCPSCSVVIFAQTQRIAGTVVVGDVPACRRCRHRCQRNQYRCRDDVDGKFVIAEAPASAQRLVVYHVGMQRKRGRCCSQRYTFSFNP